MRTYRSLLLLAYFGILYRRVRLQKKKMVADQKLHPLQGYTVEGRWCLNLHGEEEAQKAL